MCIRYLGLLLLTTWFPAALHGQSAAQCSPPRLDRGYFVPEEETFPHGGRLTYACEDGYKPVVDGWWATSTCGDGEWSHQPRCVGEEACIPPTIPNAKYTENPNGAYEEGHVLKITCDEGYEEQNHTTAVCKNGTWSSVPLCEKSPRACDAPPVIPHAVVIHRGYQDVFAADSEVEYQCEDGFTVEGADTETFIRCADGQWTTGPACSKVTGQSDESTEIGGGGGHTPPAGSGTPPAGGATSCHVDTRLIPALEFIGDRFIQHGGEMNFDCVKQYQWWFAHHSVARCSHGSTTFTRCCNSMQHNTNWCQRCITIRSPRKKVDLCTSE